MVNQKQYYNELVKFIKIYIHYPENFSVDPAGRCYYRGPNNTKCIVGQYIPDDEYKPGFEGETINICSHTFKELMKKWLPFFDRDFWDDMQKLHDYIGIRKSQIREKEAIEKLLFIVKKYCPDYEKKIVGLYYS